MLGDRSLTAQPGDWARAVAAAVSEFGAESVTAEANQGGEMVRSVLRNAGVTARVELRHAKVGKRERAQPVAALYEQGKMTHCGDFALLEEEMCGLGSGAGLADRVDALVWALTELTRGGEGPRIRFL